MRKLVYILLLVTIAVFNVNTDGFAQENEDNRPRMRRDRESSEDREERMKQRIENRITEMDKAVKLEDKQKEQIRKILTEGSENTLRMFSRTRSRDEERRPSRDGESTPSRDERASMLRNFRLQRQKQQDAINAILTEGQLKKYNAYQIKQQVDPRIARLDKELELKDNQKKKIRKILEQDIEKTREIMGKVPETSEERTKQRTVLQAQRSNTEKAIEKILTDEQKEKYKTRGTQRPRGRRRAFE